MKKHEAAKKFVQANTTLGNLRVLADDNLRGKIAEAQDLITQVCDGIYPDIIDEIRRECIDVTG